MTIGNCKLTGERGKFVKSHLIPKALTRPSEPGRPFVQYGRGSRPVKRWDSWYDKRLVTQAGEDILAKLDAWAIPKLRTNKLIWSGWGPMRVLPSNLHSKIPRTHWGFREVEDIDSHQLRLFFLSLLWRAAATDRSEFSEVALPHEDLEQLRTMILAGDPSPSSFYPISLTQLSTVGPEQNMVPIASTKQTPALGDVAERTIPIFRFYFEGLIAHFDRPSTDGSEVQVLEKIHLGAGASFIVSTVSYEASFQRKNLEQLQFEAESEWLHVLSNL